ncbi:MAG TPA: hypothetical protein VGQ83_21595 [Polyangia bacterium]|jgi:hypothetical protein
MHTPLALSRLAAIAGLLLVATLAWAKPPTPLPPLEGGSSRLQMRVLRYTGGVNGEMVVEVQNAGPRPETFTAQGLYFVPEGDPDKAPQRLGAAGPFQIDGQQGAAVDKLPLPPGAKAQVRLQVFCIDSHRSSPTADHTFRLGKERLPRELRSEIEGKAKAALGRHGGKMPAAKAAIQSEVWGARDKKWIRLDGERRQEKNASPAPRPQRPYPHKHPVQQRRID